MGGAKKKPGTEKVLVGTRLETQSSAKVRSYSIPNACCTSPLLQKLAFMVSLGLVTYDHLEGRCLLSLLIGPF